MHCIRLHVDTCMCAEHECMVHACFLHSTLTYPALLLTAVRPLTPVFSKLLIRFSGIPHNPKPVLEHKKKKVMDNE